MNQVVNVSTMAFMIISPPEMLGTSKFLLVLLFFSCHTDYTAVAEAAECGPCQRKVPGGVLIGDLDNEEPNSLGCTTKFYEVKFDTPAIRPPCAKDEEKICKPNALLINLLNFCKRCLNQQPLLPVQRDEQSRGDAASVCLLGHLFLLPIVNLILV